MAEVWADPDFDAGEGGEEHKQGNFYHYTADFSNFNIWYGLEINKWYSVVDSDCIVMFINLNFYNLLFNLCTATLSYVLVNIHFVCILSVINLHFTKVFLFRFDHM